MYWTCSWDEKMNRQKLINYLSESTKTFQTESTWSCVSADAKHLVVKVTHSIPGSFCEIITCGMFISVNAIQKFLSHELILVIHGHDQRMSKVNLHLPGLWK